MHRIFLATSLILLSAIARADLDALGFLAGTWHSSNFGKGASEVWTPCGTSIAGVFTGELNDGRVITELMPVDSTGDGVVLRWIHFNQDYSRWEKAPIEHVLVEIRSNYANFQMMDPVESLPRNMVYSLRGDELSVWIGDLEAEDQSGAFELTFLKSSLNTPLD
ncbi:MAG: hypothetical protein ACJAX5_003061 [Patiriisocius sp.]|jgi:hypothetical protein